LHTINYNVNKLFFKCAFNLVDLKKYGDEGTFVKLGPLMNKFGPNFKKALEMYPSVAKGIKMLDGNIYAFPYI
jgi:putative aldouronate transport system substrate-binding protein